MIETITAYVIVGFFGFWTIAFLTYLATNVDKMSARKVRVIFGTVIIFALATYGLARGFGI